MRPAALFDLDGVLADSTESVTSCVNHALEVTGHGRRPLEQLLEFIGPPTRIGMGALIGEPPASPAVEECVAAYRAAYAEALWQTPSYPGVPEAVRQLAGEGWTLAVATSKPVRFAEPVLEAIGLRDAFAVVSGPGLHGTADKSQTVADALSRLGSARAPGGAVPVAMVGDRRYDMAAARGHGLLGIGVLWGFGSREELLGAGADALVSDAGQLLGALREAATRARLRTISEITGP